MKSSIPRQGRIAGWLKSEGTNLSTLAAHLGVSPSQACYLCNSDVVPVRHLKGLKSFLSPLGKHIPQEMLPEGRDRKTGPRPGWLERKLEEARAQGRAEAEA